VSSRDIFADLPDVEQSIPAHSSGLHTETLVIKTANSLQIGHGISGECLTQGALGCHVELVLAGPELELVTSLALCDLAADISSQVLVYVKRVFMIGPFFVYTVSPLTVLQVNIALCQMKVTADKEENIRTAKAFVEVLWSDSAVYSMEIAIPDQLCRSDSLVGDVGF
jgi:hypothetical protein